MHFKLLTGIWRKKGEERCEEETLPKHLCFHNESHSSRRGATHPARSTHKLEKGPFALAGNQRGRKLARLSVSQKGHLSSQIKGHLTGRLLYFNVHADDQRTGCFSPQQGLKNQDIRCLCVIMFPAKHSCGLHTEDLPWLSRFKCRVEREREEKKGKTYAVRR